MIGDGLLKLLVGAETKENGLLGGDLEEGVKVGRGGWTFKRRGETRFGKDRSGIAVIPT